MLSSSVRCLRNSASNRSLTRLRTATTEAQKRAGDISDAFVSLSGQDFKPLGTEYADLKRRLIRGQEDEVQESWNRLLRDLREEIPHIVELGSKVIPEIDFKDLDNPSEEFSSQLRSRGVAVVRGVVSEEEALKWKEDLREYVRQNPQTKGKHAFRNELYFTCAKSISFPSRQASGLRALLVPEPNPRSRPPEHA